MKRPINLSVISISTKWILLLLFLLLFGFIERVQAMSRPDLPWPSDLKLINYQGGFECEIRSHSSSGNMRLEGVVRAKAPKSGAYSFVVTKQGSGGSSSVAQRGLFAVDANEEKVVGVIALNLLAGDKYLARLQITSGENETICDYQIE